MPTLIFWFRCKKLIYRSVLQIWMKIVGYQICLRITRFVILVIRPDYQKFCLRSTPAVVYDIYCSCLQEWRTIYIKSRRSHDWLFTWFVCLFVSPLLCLGRFGQLLRHANKRIVNIMKVYIEKNNLQVELIRYHIRLYSRLLLRSDRLNGISPIERKVNHVSFLTVYRD